MLGRLGHRSEKLLVPLGTLHSLSGWRTPNSFRVGRQVNREAGSSLQNHRLASLLYAARGHAKRRVGGGGGDSLGPPVCAGGGGGGVRERQGRGHGSPCTVLCRLVNLLENRHYPSKLWGWGGWGGSGGSLRQRPRVASGGECAQRLPWAFYQTGRGWMGMLRASGTAGGRRSCVGGTFPPSFRPHPHSFAAHCFLSSRSPGPTAPGHASGHRPLRQPYGLPAGADSQERALIGFAPVGTRPLTNQEGPEGGVL